MESRETVSRNRARSRIADYELTRALPTEFAGSLPSIEEIEAELSQNLKVVPV